MMKRMLPPTIAGLSIAALLAAGPAAAQQTIGTPGSPGATTTIEGRYLPPPPQQFRGEINTNAAQSTPYWPELVVPPESAPNILLIMTDDVGFSAPSTFGGVIPTPTLDRIASTGLRYTRFHTTRAGGSDTRGKGDDLRDAAGPAISAAGPTVWQAARVWEKPNILVVWGDDVGWPTARKDRARNPEEVARLARGRAGNAGRTQVRFLFPR